MNEINIGNIIYQKRKEKNMTQEDLANYLNITKAAISKWEKIKIFLIFLFYQP